MQTAKVSGQRTRTQIGFREGIKQEIVSVYEDNLHSIAGLPQQQT